jgi:hypothetical protein
VVETQAVETTTFQKRFCLMITCGLDMMAIQYRHLLDHRITHDFRLYSSASGRTEDVVPLLNVSFSAASIIVSTL